MHKGFPKLFIAGAHRSGTTWVRTIFYNHPMVIKAGKIEPEVYEVVLFPLINEGLTGDDLWMGIMDNYDRYAEQHRCSTSIFGTREEFAELLLAASRLDAPTIRQTLWVIETIYTTHFNQSGGGPGHLLVDKSPKNIFVGSIILDQFPEAKLIEVIRDGRDVAVSAHKRFPQEGRSIASRISIWKRFVLAGEELQRIPRFKDRILRVRYEELLRDLRGNIEALFTFAGIEWSPSVLDTVYREASLDRMKETHPWSTREGKAGAWKDEMTQDDRAFVDVVAGDLLRYLGYD